MTPYYKHKLAMCCCYVTISIVQCTRMVLVIICTLFYSLSQPNNHLLQLPPEGSTCLCADLSSSNRLCGFLRALPHLDLTLISLADTNYYHPLLGKGSSLDIWHTALDTGLSRTGACCMGRRKHRLTLGRGQVRLRVKQL